jgi:hypothetical protein
MDQVSKATKTLRDAEASLRSLVSDAAAGGDYASVVQIAAWARTLSELLKDAPGPTQHGGLAHKERSPVATKMAAPAKRSSTSRLKDKYPLFFRSGDRLVRVAWSKSDRREYEHKAPYAMLKSLSAKLAECAADGRVFSMEQVLPIFDEDGTEIPSYQAYAGLALLKHSGLIDQHGRQGYSIPALPKFRAAVEGVWRNLPEK